MRIPSIFIALTLSILSPTITWAAEEKQPITIAFPTWAGSGVVFLAKEKGYFGDLNVEIKVMDDTNAMITAFRAGQLDIATTTPDNMAILSAQGIEGKIFYMTDYSDGADGIIAQKNIKNVAQLKGKTVGYVRGYASHYLLYKALEKAGLTTADVKGTGFDDPSMAATAMLSGQVDAAVTWEPFLTQTVSERKGNLLASTRDMGDLIPGNLIASNKMIATRVEDLKNIARALQKAYADVQKDPVAASIVFGKGFNTKAKDMEDSMKGIHFADGALNAKHLCGDKPRTAEIVEDAAQFWFNEKITDKKNVIGKDAISTVACDVFVQ